MFCYTLRYVHSSIATILIGKRELVALLNLSPWCLVMVEWFFLAVPWSCLRFVIEVFPDHTHLLFLLRNLYFCDFPGGGVRPTVSAHDMYRTCLKFGLSFYYLPNLVCESSGSFGESAHLIRLN